MMNYELAKKLKDAGFPPPEVTTTGDYSSWTIEKTYGGAYATNEHLIRVFPGMSYSRDLVYVPILSELIEAMPMRAKYLGTINDAHFVLRKLVSVVPERYWAYMEDEDTNLPVEGYSFRDMPAEEAVANLWLALNQK